MGSPALLVKWLTASTFKRGQAWNTELVTFQIKIMKIYFLFYCVALANSKITCSRDEECSEEEPCCSSFGYCRKSSGFCEPSSRSDSKTITNERQRKPRQNTKDKATRETSSKSGAGCVLENVEWVGGDLPPIVGGGGVHERAEGWIYLRGHFPGWM